VQSIDNRTLDFNAISERFMFNKIYNYAKGSYESTKATGEIVFNNFSAFCGGVARPAVEGTVLTTGIVIAKTVIHVARFAHDATIDLVKIAYNVVKTGVNFTKTGTYDWSAGNWHANDKTKIIIKSVNTNSVIDSPEDASQFSKLKNFVSKTWSVKDNSSLGQVANDLDHGTVIAKLVVDAACLVQSVIWDAMIVTVVEGLSDTSSKAWEKGYEAADENQKAQNSQYLEDMNSVADILGLNVSVEDAEDMHTGIIGDELVDSTDLV